MSSQRGPSAQPFPILFFHLFNFNSGLSKDDKPNNLKKYYRTKIVDFPDGTLIISEKIIKLNICTSLKGNCYTYVQKNN